MMFILNKNDNIHKSEAQEIEDKTNIDKYREAANIKEFHIISKLIFLRIIIPKFMFSCKNFNNQHD